MARIAAIVAFVLASAALIGYSLQKGAPFGWVEAVGFVTGALCVGLTVYENVWNFPIGISNSVFLGILFLEGRLFADAGLQLMFIALGFQGWYLWLYGGAHRTELPVSRIAAKDVWQGLVLTVIALPLLTWRLILIKDAAPFLDALITVLSVVAQILLNRKRLESWFVWIAVDAISIGLYAAKGLALTAVLYALFLALCVKGYAVWREDLVHA